MSCVAPSCPVTPPVRTLTRTCTVTRCVTLQDLRAVMSGETTVKKGKKKGKRSKHRDADDDEENRKR